MSVEITDVLFLLTYVLLMAFTAYQAGKDDGWREGFGDGWVAHKKVGTAIEEFNRAVFDAGATWSCDEKQGSDQ